MIDAHFHSWLLSRDDYGWLTPALPAIYRDVSIADWQARASAHGVKAGVLVQAAPPNPKRSGCWRRRNSIRQSTWSWSAPVISVNGKTPSP